jgi:hypothetical protein
MKKLLSSLLLVIGLASSTLFAQSSGTAAASSEPFYTGTKITLRGEALGTPTPTFAWFKDNTQVSTGTDLVFNSIQTSDAGVYKVRATNLAGSADSSDMTAVIITAVSPTQVKIIVIRG